MKFRDELTEVKIHSDSALSKQTKAIMAELKKEKVEPKMLEIRSKRMILSYDNSKEANKAIAKLGGIMDGLGLTVFDYPTKSQDGFSFIIVMN